MQALSHKPTQGTSPVSPFVRPASGLVREITAWQVFGFNVMNANIGIGLVWLTLLGPGLYPGANLYLAVLLAFVGILPLNLLYVRLAVAFPRSGGDYVSISRTLSPALGFAVNAAAMAYFCLFVGLGGLYTVQYGLTPLARVWAAYSGASWARHLAERLGTPTGTFLVSLAVLAAYALLMIRGGKLYFRAQGAAFVLGTAALAVVVGAGLLLSHSGALAHLDGALARLHAGPIAPLAAGHAAAFSWSATLHAAIWPWIVFVGCYFSVFIAGEVRRPARTQAIGVLGSLTWTLAWLLVVVFALSHLFGQTLFANLAATPPDKLGLASTPAFAELTALGSAPRRARRGAHGGLRGVGLCLGGTDGNVRLALPVCLVARRPRAALVRRGPPPLAHPPPRPAADLRGGDRVHRAHDLRPPLAAVGHDRDVHGVALRGPGGARAPQGGRAPRLCAAAGRAHRRPELALVARGR